MHEEQARINATISYFFLGPLFLIAKSGSPLADPYVRLHSKKSSLIIGWWLLGYLAYYILKPLLVFSLFGIPLTSIVLWTMIFILVGNLVYFAYKAYHWDSKVWMSITWQKSDLFLFKDYHGISDEEKIRIFASFVPLLGIWISSKYTNDITLLWRKVGTFGFIIIIISLLILDSTTGSSFIVILGVIALIIYTWVSLFLRGSLPILRIYEWIPSYLELKTHVKSSFTWLIWIINILNGKNTWASYMKIYNENLTTESLVWYKVPFMINPRIIGIPVLNLITISTLFQEKYSEYKEVILQGAFLTLLFITLWFLVPRSPLQLLLVIPMVHLLSFAHLSPSTRAPGVDLIISLSAIFHKWKKRVEVLKDTEEKISYTYSQNTDGK